MNPYMIGDGNLGFTKFPDVIVDTQHENEKMKIVFVFDSGRCNGAAHVSYSIDAILVPEITVLLVDWAERGCLDFPIRSFPDIDLWTSRAMAEYNLFLLGSEGGE